MDDSVDFYRDWADYVAGFGDLTGSHWAGLDKIHSMTSANAMELLVTMETFDNKTYEARYSSFSVGDAASKYMLSVSGYNSNSTADERLMRYNNGKRFSTKDQDNDSTLNFDCAASRQAGWWFGHCTHANLNGPYRNNTDPVCGAGNTILWHPRSCLKTVTMSVRKTP